MKSLKNVDSPIEVFKMVMPWEGAIQSNAFVMEEGRTRSGQRKGHGITSVGRYFEKIGMKDRITVVKIRNSPGIPEILMKFSQAINYEVGETFHVTSVTYSVSVVVDSKNVDALTRLIPKKDVLAVFPRLAEITISLPDETQFVPGIVGAIGTELARHGISIFEYFTSTPEQIVVVNESDALKSYQLLRDLSKGA